MKTLKCIAKLGLVTSILFSNVALAKTIIKVGHYNADTHPSNVALQEYFKKLLKKKQVDVMKFVFIQITN